MTGKKFMFMSFEHKKMFLNLATRALIIPYLTSIFRWIELIEIIVTTSVQYGTFKRGHFHLISDENKTLPNISPFT